MSECTAYITNHSYHNHNGSELITFTVTLPKFLLAQLNTHRAFNRNTESSRAIPIHRMTARVLEAPVESPELFKGAGGMSPSPERLEGYKRILAAFLWRSHRTVSIAIAKGLRWCGVPKEWANRPLDTHVFVRVLLTTTREGLDNFLSLRQDTAAQDFMQQLAHAMSRAYVASQPTYLDPGEWHTPFRRDNSKALLTLVEAAQQIARAARISYGTDFDAPLSDAAAISLVYDKLAGGEKLHASPFEHLACAVQPTSERLCAMLNLHRNFPPSWVQYRALLESGYDLMRPANPAMTWEVIKRTQWSTDNPTGLPQQEVATH